MSEGKKKSSFQELIEAVTPKPYALDLPVAGPVTIKHLRFRDSGALHQLVYDGKIASDAQIVTEYLVRVATHQSSDETTGRALDPEKIAVEDLNEFAVSALKHDHNVPEVSGDPVHELASIMRAQWKKDDERAKDLAKAASDWVSPLTKSLLAQADEVNEFAKGLSGLGAMPTAFMAGIEPAKLGVSAVPVQPLPARLPEINFDYTAENRTARATEDLLVIAGENLKLGRGAVQQISSMYEVARSWNADVARRQEHETDIRNEDVQAVKRTINIAKNSLIVAVVAGGLSLIASGFSCWYAYQSLAVARDSLNDARDSGKSAQEAKTAELRSLEREHADLQALLQSSASDRTAIVEAITKSRQAPTETHFISQPSPKRRKSDQASVRSATR
jgi:hypothetical protein